ncbi:MAG: hypothetical protein Q9174_005936 [Haloplaca sp. 1 TL-2023]
MVSTPSASTLFIIRNNLSLQTWLLIGAVIQSLLFLALPRRFALLPPFCALVLLASKNVLISFGILKNPYMSGAVPGKWTVPLRENGKQEGDKVAVFLLGASSNHPLGLLAPGFGDIGPLFDSMWEEAEADTDKSGLIGKSTVFMPVPASDEASGVALIIISYWKSIEHLHAFAQGPAHRKGWDWWEAEARKKHPHLGIMHETFEAPKGRWENVYEGFVPTGMGESLIISHARCWYRLTM